MRTIIVLDSDHEMGLGASVTRLLTAGLLDIEVRHIEFGAGEALPPLHGGAAEAPVDGAAGEGAAACFLVLSRAALAAARAVLAELHERAGAVPVIAVLARAEPDEVLGLLELGVHDFLVPPLEACAVLPRLWRVLGMAAPAGGGAVADSSAAHGGRPERTAAAARAADPRQLNLIGESRSFAAVFEMLRPIAQSNAAVLISGETGTGKELFARSIHYLSARAKKPFVAVNCGAIPTELVENELFGHERSAFTGAHAARPGLVQEAEGGTLFLDEVDSLPLLAQVKLLRLLEEKEYRPLGAARACRADVRILAAANGDLEQAVAAGRLRQDLYYRLNVLPLHLPPLRERRQDIPLLARHFLDRYTRENGRPPARFAAAAMQRLLAYDWPGNVRELEHAVERAVVLAPPGAVIDDPGIAPPSRQNQAGETHTQAKARAVARFEEGYIRGLLLAHDGNISRAARAADKNRRAFWELIRKHRIDARSFRQDRS